MRQTPSLSRSTQRLHALLLGALIAMPTASALAQSSSAAASSANFSAGIEIKGSASAADVGLPLYPGAQPYVDKDDDKSSVTMGLWGGGFGFRLVVTKYTSADSMDKLSAFYRDALGKYGPVLDCSLGQPAGGRKEGKQLGCEKDRPDKGGQLYKAGLPENYRLVALQQVGKSVHFQLVRIELPKHN